VRGPLPIAVLVVVFSAFFGTAMVRVHEQNAELTATRAEVARLSHETGVAAERQRLAGEIHDTIAQGLSSVVMLVQAAEADLDRAPARARRHLAMIARTARDNLDEARALVAALAPTALDGASLAEAVGRLVGNFTAETGVRVSYDLVGTPKALPTGLDVVLLRAAQEALSNVRKHAAAGSVTVRLAYGTAAVVLGVRDDGRGFDPGQPATGYGLGAMRSRVGQVGGTLSVESTPGTGTTVRAEVPA